jgi:hypothetical protein
MMTMPSTTFTINLNVVLSASGSFTGIINFQNFPLAFGGVQLTSFQLQQSISPTSVSYSLLIALSFKLSGQPLIAVGQFGFTQFGAVTALGATIQIASGSLTGVSTASSSSYYNLLPGQSIWFNPFGVGSRIGIILPITLGIVMGVTNTVPPLPAPLQIQFSGGFVIGRTYASVALQVNIPNMQIAIAATIGNPNIINLVEDMVGCNGCFSAASTFLTKFFSVQSVYFSFNPTPLPISVGTTISSIVIPPGLVLKVTDLIVFDIFHIINGLFQFNAGGVSASLTFAPIVLIPNYVELRQGITGPINFDLPGSDLGAYYPSQDDPSLCNAKCVSYSGCLAWVYASPKPGFGCSSTGFSVPTCFLKSSNTMTPVPNKCLLSQTLDPNAKGTSTRATSLGPTMQLTIGTNAGPTAYISAGLYIFGASLGLQMSLKQDSSFVMLATMVDPSLLNVGLVMSGYTYNPATWTATVSATVNPQIIAQALAAGLPVISNAFNNVVNKMNSALSAFNSANNALSSASNKLNSAKAQVAAVAKQILDAQASVMSQLNCYNSHRNAIADCTRHYTIWCGVSCSTYCNPVRCSWRGCSGGDCHTNCDNRYCDATYQDPTCLVNNAYHSSVAGICYTAYQVATNTLNSLSNGISQAANFALKIAQDGLNAAQSAVSSTQTAYQAATNAVGQFAGALTSGIQWFIANALAIQSITLTATLGRSTISGSIQIIAKIGSSTKTWTLSTGNAFAGITPDAISSMVVSNCQSFLSSIGVTVRRLQETPLLSASGNIHQTLSTMPDHVRMAIQGMLDVGVPTTPQFFDVAGALRTFSYTDILNKGAGLVAGLAGDSAVYPPALVNVTFTNTVNTYVNVSILNQNAYASVWIDPATATITVGAMTYLVPGTPANITDNTCYNGVCGLAAIPFLKLITYVPNETYLCNLASDVSSIRLSQLTRSRGAAGPLPSCIAKYNATVQLSCDTCFINGTLAMYATLNSSSVFSTLVLPNNYLTGSIPSNFSTVVPALRNVNLQNNYLSGDLSFLLNSKVSSFLIDGNQFSDPNVAYYLTTMTAVSHYSMLQSTTGIPYISRAVVPPTPKTRIVVILNIQPNFAALCAGPSGGDDPGLASVCHLDTLPMQCANAYCKDGALTLANNLTNVLIPPSGGILGSMNSLSGFDSIANIMPVSSTQWLVRYEIDYFSIPTFTSTDLAGNITSAIRPGLNDTYSSILTSVQVFYLCPPGRFGPDCSTFCPTAWISFEEKISPSTTDPTSSLSSYVPSATVKNMTRQLLDFCETPPSCVGYTGVCSSAIDAMNAACDFYNLSPASGSLVNVSSMGTCCSLANSAISACSVSTNEPSLPKYCMATPMGIAGKCAALPNPTYVQPATPVGWSFYVTLNDNTNALSLIFASDSNYSQGILNAFTLDVAGASGVLPSQVKLASITDVTIGTVRTNAIANVTVTPQRTPSITSSVTPSNTVSSSQSATASASATSSATPSASVSTSVSSSPSPSTSNSPAVYAGSGSGYTDGSESGYTDGSRRLATGSQVLLLFTITAVSQTQANLINSFFSLSSTEDQFARGVAALSAVSAGKNVPSFVVQKTAIVSGIQAVPPASTDATVSGGAIAGIVIAAIAFVAIFAVIVFLVVNRSKKSVAASSASTDGQAPEDVEI